MKLRQFLTALLALIPLRCFSNISAPKRATTKSEIEALSEAYYAAASALIHYKRDHGFEPGAVVRCQWRSEPIIGTISEYGDGWAHCEHTSVLVDLDNGRRKYRQPWSVSDLTILEPAPPRS